jgi:hypothetical protein
MTSKILLATAEAHRSNMSLIPYQAKSQIRRIRRFCAACNRAGWCPAAVAEDARDISIEEATKLRILAQALRDLAMVAHIEDKRKRKAPKPKRRALASAICWPSS